MGFIKLFAAWAAGAISSNTIFQVCAQKSSNITSELGSQLSPGASILLPGFAEFTNATTRWQQYRDPEIHVVVAVTNEHDVQQTLCDMINPNTRNANLAPDPICQSTQHAVSGHGIWSRKCRRIRKRA
jgi:hypothetical protein